MQSHTEVYKNEWEDSYKRKENFVFLASDETIRFISKYLVKRVGLNSFKKLYPYKQKLKVLDVCCGIGRTSVYGEQMGLDMFGFDLSEEAVESAIEHLKSYKIKKEFRNSHKSASIANIPWEKDFFDHAICDSALDSMRFSIAKKGIKELARVIKNGGFFYCNLISGEIASDSISSEKEVVIDNLFEKGTIQSYFDQNKIKSLLEPCFEIINYELHKVYDENEKLINARWHIVCKKI